MNASAISARLNADTDEPYQFTGIFAGTVKQRSEYVKTNDNEKSRSLGRM